MSAAAGVVADVVVLAELNPDVLVRCAGDQPRFGQVEQTVADAGVVLGSSGAITAAALAAQGQRVALCGVIGDDRLGELTVDLLREAGVDAGAVVSREGIPTGMTVVLSRPDGDRALLTYPGAMAALRAQDVPLELLKAARHVHVSSFYLQRALRPGLAELLAAARRGGATTSLDPGWDPDEEWGSLAPVLPQVDYVLPNAAECSRIAAALGLASDSPLTAARSIAERGPTVVVKLGAQGAAWVSAHDTVVVPTTTAPIVDTTGAGDNFNAGFLAGALAGASSAEAVARGVASGALAVSGFGGTGRMADQTEAERGAATLLAAAPSRPTVDSYGTRREDGMAELGSITRHEVESQPEIWARVLEEAPAIRKVLPADGVPVLFVGCGTSYYIGDAYARLRNAAGRGRARAAVASEIPYADSDETLLVLSRSGTTSDVVRVIEEFRGRTPVLGIVGEPGTPVAELCDEVVLLDYADEQSVVQTRFATAALLLLRAALGEDVGDLPEQARAALELELPSSLPRHTVFLGTGWTIGLAHEAALKCREAAGAWTEAYPVMEYQHGPIAVAGPESLVWSLVPLPPFVREPIEATGARVFEPELDPLAQVVAVHRLALRLAEAAGRDADQPQHLSRSVRLD